MVLSLYLLCVYPCSLAFQPCAKIAGKCLEAYGFRGSVYGPLASLSLGLCQSYQGGNSVHLAATEKERGRQEEVGVPVTLPGTSLMA